MADSVLATEIPTKPAEKKETSLFANMGLLFKEAGANANMLKGANLSSEMQMHLSMNYIMNGLKKFGMEGVFEPMMGILKMFGLGPSADVAKKLDSFGDTMTRLDKGNSKDFVATLTDELKTGKLKLAPGTDEKTFIDDMTKFADKVYANGLTGGEKQIMQAKLADGLQTLPNQTATPMALTANGTSTYNEALATSYFQAAQGGAAPLMSAQFAYAAPNTKPDNLLEKSITPDNELRAASPSVMQP